jgi:hypothetical protein
MKNSILMFVAILKKPLILLGFLCLGVTQSSLAQDSKGTEFWICFPGNLSSGVVQLYITGEQSSTVTVTVPGIAFNQVVVVPAGGLQVVNLPATVQVQTQFVADNKGIHITATNEVTVYGMNAQTATTDAFLAFPLDALGKDHFVLGYNKDFSFSNPTQATFVATENNTTVTVTTSVTEGGFVAGVPKNIVLQQGQVYQLRSLSTNADYSGSKIVSDKPISVFGGAQCTNISGNLRACDHLVEQLPPVTSWGRSFVTVPLATRTGGDVFRFLAQTNGTAISVNGVVVTNLNAGQFFETILGSNSYNRITSNQPILVGQYSRSSEADGITSDPFFALVPPDEQFLNAYTVSAGTSNIPINFINITSPSANIGTVKVDNVVVAGGLWNPIPGTSFSGAKVPVAAGVHRVISTLPIGVLVYGFGSFDSYGYLGGQSFSAVATVSSVTISLTQGSTVAVGTQYCLDATVRDQNNNPLSGIRVDFNVTGVNPKVDFAFTNASGVATFCYTGANPGTDHIVASVGAISDATDIIWTPLVAATVYYSKSTGDLHNVATWGVNPDGSGANPSDFGAGKTFNLANRVTNYTLTADWTVAGLIVNPAGGQLQINGFTLSEAGLSGAGTVSGSPTSNLIVTGSAGHTLNFTLGSVSSRTLNNLTLDRTAAADVVALGVGLPLNILNVLSVNVGTLNTNNSLTLRSTATNTARVAPITASGIVSGNVTVERYIPARRAWRIMSAPVGGTQNINAAWQEGATTSSGNPNPNPGYGTHITEGSAAVGFDHNPLTALVSVKKYLSASDAWTSLANTNATPVNNDAYLLFVRGDRGIPLGANNVAPNNTVLRANGPLKIGDQAFPVSASGFTAIPNPFASPIDFATLTRTNVQNNFYLWDPKLGGEFGVGGYVLLSFNGVGYDVTPAAVSPESQYIQSGQGFLVHSTGAAGNIIIKETDKSATAATDVFRTSNSTRNLRVSLQTVNADNTSSLVDEVLSSYNNGFSNKLDGNDAFKMSNINENLSIVREGQHFMLERRQDIAQRDTIQLSLSNPGQKTYFFEFSAANLSSPSLSAVLVDKYLHTSTPVSLSETSRVYFTVKGRDASGASDRFMIVLASAKSQPITNVKTGVWAYPNPINGKNINVQLINQPKGTYSITLMNSLGQAVYQSQIKHAGGTLSQTLQFSKKLVEGIYQLRVAGGNRITNIKVLSN